MERAGNLLIEENVAHRLENMGVEAQGELPDVARTRVAIENLVQPLGIIPRRLHHPALPEHESDMVERGAQIDRRCIILDDPVDAVLDRTGEHLAIGDVAQAAAFLRPDALDREVQIRAGTLEVHPVGAAHEISERLHAWLHATVVQRADPEIKILEGLGAHAGLLGHGGSGPAQHHPLCVVHAVVLHRLHQPGDQLGPGGRYVGGLEDIGRTAQRDIGVHLLHAGEFHRGMRRVLGLDRLLHQFAGHAGVVEQRKWQGAAPPGGTDESHHHGFRHVKGLDQHALAFFQTGREAREQLGQLVETGIGNHDGMNTARLRPCRKCERRASPGGYLASSTRGDGRSVSSGKQMRDTAS